MWETGVVVVLIVTSYVCAASSVMEEEDDVMKALYALENVINWSFSHYDSLILDSVFSLRIAEGEIETILANSPLLATDVRVRLTVLHHRLTRLSQLTIDKIQQSDLSYYAKLKGLVDEKLQIRKQYPVHRSLPNMVKPLSQNDEQTYFDETASDDCMQEVLGNDNYEPCNITLKCYNQMSGSNAEDYQLSHQILFFILAKAKGCWSRVEQIRLKKHHNLGHFFKVSIARMYGKLPDLLKTERYDLFSEIMMVGQMLNYNEFHNEWLRELIYLWQDETGCFHDETYIPVSKHVHSKAIGRRIFAEEIIDGQCSAHFTSVCMACVTYILSELLLPSDSLAPAQYSDYRVIIGFMLFVVMGYFLRKKRVILRFCFRRRRLL